MIPDLRQLTLSTSMERDSRKKDFHHFYVLTFCLLIASVYCFNRSFHLYMALDFKSQGVRQDFRNTEVMGQQIQQFLIKLVKMFSARKVSENCNCIMKIWVCNIVGLKSLGNLSTFCAICTSIWIISVTLNVWNKICFLI